MALVSETEQIAAQPDEILLIVCAVVVIVVTANIFAMVYSLQSIGRLFKIALFGFCLMFSGAPGLALHLCAQPAGSHTHSCCMGNHPTPTGGGSAAQVDSASCCKVAPVQSQPIQTLSPSKGSIDGAPALHATTGSVFILAVPPTRTDPGGPQLAKSLKPPVRALLCTFLI